MFRGYKPALTLLVFAFGLGLGFSWTRGLIPLAITPANSGSLSLEVAHRESLPPPNDPSKAAGRARQYASFETQADDPEIFEQQSEPPIDHPQSIAETDAAESDRVRSRQVLQNAEFSTSTDETNRSNSIADHPRTSPPIRTRSRNAVERDAQAGVENRPAIARSRKVIATAHQNPHETDDENQSSSSPAKESSLSPSEQLAAAEEKLAAGETLAAHRDLSKLYWNHKELRPQLQETIDSTSKAIFFQAKPNYIEPYVIQEGERLEAIAKRYQLSWEYLARLNHTEPRRIQIGQKLKVVKGPFAAVVDLKEFALTVHLQGYYVKRYDVGIGEDGSSPIGKFTVLNKVENPQYTDPKGKVIPGDDPTNPLGERWLDLGEGYGIHGTIDPSSIGKAKSRGCIRLRDKEIIEVYDFLVRGSEVIIRK